MGTRRSSDERPAGAVRARTWPALVCNGGGRRPNGDQRTDGDGRGPGDQRQTNCRRRSRRRPGWLLLCSAPSCRAGCRRAGRPETTFAGPIDPPWSLGEATPAPGSGRGGPCPRGTGRVADPSCCGVAWKRPEFDGGARRDAHHPGAAARRGGTHVALNGHLLSQARRHGTNPQVKAGRYALAINLDALGQGCSAAWRTPTTNCGTSNANVTSAKGGAGADHRPLARPRRGPRWTPTSSTARTEPPDALLDDYPWLSEREGPPERRLARGVPGPSDVTVACRRGLHDRGGPRPHHADGSTGPSDPSGLAVPEERGRCSTRCYPPPRSWSARPCRRGACADRGVYQNRIDRVPERQDGAAQRRSHHHHAVDTVNLDEYDRWQMYKLLDRARGESSAATSSSPRPSPNSTPT